MTSECSSSALSPKDALAALRSKSPLTQCITNTVVSGFTANVLLAIGAAPAMVDYPGEAGEFAAVADGVLINLGTPFSDQLAATSEIPSVTRRWVLDPVAIGALSVRTKAAGQLADRKPAIIRGNASEIIALAGRGSGGRGVDSAVGSDAALEAATWLARCHGSVVAVSGETDLITDGTKIASISGGNALITLVTGGGCTLGATMAAFLGVCDPWSAALAASVAHKAAAANAGKVARGPGSFAAAFLDELFVLDEASMGLDIQIQSVEVEL